ncbi:MAG: MBL fold metallo-hydrolase [Acidobacteria bacterium]|nr:MBL fold metallo-hydrolase [Acidobacteriota bacterium]
MLGRLLKTAVLAGLSVQPGLAAPPTYQVARVADGIVAFIASESNNGIVSGNCVAVIGDDGVLVVDTTSFPSHARSIIDEIRKLTSQPVRFVVHTHWHPDHIMGDGEFEAAFPGVAFVSTRPTREAIASSAPKYIKGNAEQGEAYAAMMRKQVQEGKGDGGKILTEADRKFLTEYASTIDFAVPEYRKYKSVLPGVVFDETLTVHLGKREVRVLFLGRGNTAGDAVVFVPDAKVVVTGDLLVTPTPYSYGSFLTEWIRTLDRVKGLGATTTVPGHGPVQHDNSYLDQVSAALQSVVTQVRAAVASRLSLEDTRKRVGLDGLRQKFCGGDHDREAAFHVGFVEPAVERADQEAKFGSED